MEGNSNLRCVSAFERFIEIFHVWQPTNTVQSDDTMSEDEAESVQRLQRASSWPTEASSSRVRVKREEKQVPTVAMYWWVSLSIFILNWAGVTTFFFHPVVHCCSKRQTQICLFRRWWNTTGTNWTWCGLQGRIRPISKVEFLFHRLQFKQWDNEITYLMFELRSVQQKFHIWKSL
jgi:hypothetical protein